MTTAKTTMTIEKNIVKIKTSDLDDIEFELDWDMFMVPVQNPTMKTYSLKYDYAQKLFSALTELHLINGTFPNYDDHVVMVWFTNDLTQNLVKDGMRIIINRKEYATRLKTRNYITESIAQMFHEGETTTLKMILELEPYDSYGNLEVTMIAHITPRQQAYQYASVGTWDDALDYVTK